MSNKYRWAKFNMTYTSDPYRLGVGMIVMNKNGLVFVGQRIDSTVEAWQLPQGGVDAGEDFEQAAFRELEEEMGTNKVELIAQSQGFYVYDVPKAMCEKIWKGKYVGQKQKWFLFRLLGNDQDINIHTKHPEFKDWKWVHPSQLEGLIVDFKKDLYRQLYEDFKSYFTSYSSSFLFFCLVATMLANVLP